MKYLKLLIIVAFGTLIGFFSAITYSQIGNESAVNDKNVSGVIIKQNELKLSKKSYAPESLLKEVISRVKQDYVEEKTDHDLAESAVKGILGSLDPHSSYLTSEDFSDMKVETKGEFGGVGIEITTEPPLIKVVSAIEDTPAFKAGVMSGDYISKIDGVTAIGMSITDVVKKLRGKPGAKVNVTILRKGEKAPLEKTLVREIIKVRAVRSDKFSDVIYVKINTFSEKAQSGVVSEITKLKSQIGASKVKGLVLDLRNNPGGLLDQAVAVSDLFLNKGMTIVSFKGRDKSSEKVIKDEENETLLAKLPIVVLVNEGSASASEIVAGAIQDNKRGIVLGTKSFGKGSVQSVIPLQNGSGGAIRMTTSLYYTPSGRSIQALGIEPDIIVTEAKIEKTEGGKILATSESELSGHLIAQEIKKSAAENQMKDDNLSLYDKDYQLARAVDLIRGLNVFKAQTK